MILHTERWKHCSWTLFQPRVLADKLGFIFPRVHLSFSSMFIPLCLHLFIFCHFIWHPPTAPLSFSLISLCLVSVTHSLPALCHISTMIQCCHGDNTRTRETDKLAPSTDTHVEHAKNTQQQTHMCKYTDFHFFLLLLTHWFDNCTFMFPSLQRTRLLKTYTDLNRRCNRKLPHPKNLRLWELKVERWIPSVRLNKQIYVHTHTLTH